MEPIFEPWAEGSDDQLDLVVFILSALIAGLCVSAGSESQTQMAALVPVSASQKPALTSAPEQTIRDDVPLARNFLDIDVEKHGVHKDGTEVPLTRTEFDLLFVLARQPGRLVRHQSIIDEIWGPDFKDGTFVLRTYIKQLRTKLGDPAHEPLFIRTERSLGYRFVGENSRISGDN